MSARAFALASLFLLGGCATDAAEKQSTAPSSEEWQRTELGFGLSIPGGGAVSEAAFDSFVAREVAPRFPAGFTLLRADGEWRSPGGEVTREESRILLLLHRRTPRDDAEIDAIRAAYKSAFHQESVLRVDEPAQVSF